MEIVAVIALVSDLKSLSSVFDPILDNILFNVAGLARKNLLASAEFFKEGINRLQMSSEVNSVIDNDLLSVTLNFISATTRLTIISEERLEDAKESFKAAREEATRAFCNEALTTEERISATKLRIASSMMQNLKNPDKAVCDAKTYLIGLHDLPAIQETFSVYLDGGVKSLFNKAKRLEIVRCVTTINLEVYNFTSRFITPDLFSWPKIDLWNRAYQPVLGDKSISLTESRVKALLPFQRQIYDEEVEISNACCSAVNSKGEIIVQSGRTTVSLINREGKSRSFCSLSIEDTVAPFFRIQSLAVDGDDNVYIVISYMATILIPDFMFKNKFILFLFSPNGNMKHKCPLDLVQPCCRNAALRLTVNKEKNIVIKISESRFVYICDSNGQLKAKFPLEDKFDGQLLSNSDTNEIIVGSLGSDAVYIYTEEGKLKREIKLPESHHAIQVAFNYNNKTIIVLTLKSNTLHLLSYSQTDEPKCLPLEPLSERQLKLSSHQNGPVTLIHYKLGAMYV